VNLQIWDTAGQERFKTITQAYYRGAMGIILVYDVTDKKSLENIRYWMSNIATHANQNVRKLLVGNKIDMNKEVSTEEAKAVSDELKIPFIEVSAKTNERVQDAFQLIGQEIVRNIDQFAHMGRSASAVNVNSTKSNGRKKCCAK